MDVPQERKFIGFDGYKKAMDCLKPGDIVILTTPPAFRWVMFTYAIEKGLNVFMEKPVTVDGPTTRKMLKLAEDASAKNLKVGVGLMSRHNRALQELAKRIQDGELGDIILLRGYRMHGPGGSAFQTKWPGNPSELLWQIRNFHAFLWASGGCFSDFYIHVIDHLCWMKGAWPVKAQALGGRHYKLNPEGVPYVDQNFDAYSAEYVFEDGARMIMDGRCMNGCHDIYNSYVHGSKASAIASKSGDCGLPSSNFHRPESAAFQNDSGPPRSRRTSRTPTRTNGTTWWTPSATTSLTTKPSGARKASLVTSMGRMAAHTGQEITYEDILNGEHEFAPDRGPTDDGFPCPGSGRPGRHVSQAHARHHQEAGILNRLNTQFPTSPKALTVCGRRRESNGA